MTVPIQVPRLQAQAEVVSCFTHHETDHVPIVLCINVHHELQ
jgi:hypothetical protein